jgi:hypothetical protein
MCPLLLMICQHDTIGQFAGGKAEQLHKVSSGSAMRGGSGGKDASERVVGGMVGEVGPSSFLAKGAAQIVGHVIVLSGNGDMDERQCLIAGG